MTDKRLREALARYQAAYARVHSAYDGECEHGFGPPATFCPNNGCPDKELAEAWSALAATPETPTLDAAWAEAEEACRNQPDRVSVPVPPWPKLQGPFPMIGRPFTYQATVTTADGGRRDDERIGLGETPASALRDLVMRLSRHTTP